MTLWNRYKDIIAANWHLGFTAFGGASVQFQIVSVLLQNGGHKVRGRADRKSASRQICRGAWVD